MNLRERDVQVFLSNTWGDESRKKYRITYLQFCPRIKNSNRKFYRLFSDDSEGDERKLRDRNPCPEINTLKLSIVCHE